MDLIAIAVPFFLLAIIIELFVNWRKQKGYYRGNDAINSISAGMLDTTLGLVRYLVTRARVMGAGRHCVGFPVLLVPSLQPRDIDPVGRACGAPPE
jgi:hypothetical protein